MRYSRRQRRLRVGVRFVPSKNDGWFVGRESDWLMIIEPSPEFDRPQVRSKNSTAELSWSAAQRPWGFRSVYGQSGRLQRVSTLRVLELPDPFQGADRNTVAYHPGTNTWRNKTPYPGPHGEDGQFLLRPSAAVRVLLGGSAHILALGSGHFSPDGTITRAPPYIYAP